MIDGNNCVRKRLFDNHGLLVGHLEGLESLFVEEIGELREVYHFREDVSKCLELRVIDLGEILQNNVNTFVILLFECNVQGCDPFFRIGINIVILKLFEKSLVDHFEILEDVL